MSLEDLVVRVLAPDASPQAFNDFRLVSGTSFEPWTLFVIGSILAISVGVSFWGLARLSKRRKTFVVVARALSAALVMFLVCLPEIELRAVSKVRSRILLLFDDSESMSLATPSGTRAEAVIEHLTKNQSEFDRLAAEGVLEIATFGEKTSPREGWPTRLDAHEKATDIGRAILEAGGSASGRDLGAIVLYSDGSDTAGLDPERAKVIAAQVGAPIFAIGFAADATAPDLAVRRILTDDFAFVHNNVTIEVEVERQGLQLDAVPVTLRKDGDVVATKTATFDSAGKGVVTFDLKPNRIGKQTLDVSVPVQPNESVSSNNQKSVVLKVIRDRIRVLQVAGRPTWDVRFLRELLKRNPNVDLISFFILRSATGTPKAPQEELSLIPFPVEELFTEELPSFDIVIYQNFTYRPYRMARFLRNIREYVLGGGSFLMIGGTDSFEDGGYAEASVGPILPVVLGGAGAYDPAEFRPRLTPEGRRHPITMIGEPGEPPDVAYERLPALEGSNQALGLAAGAQALLVHPSLPGNPPVVATREVGLGRVLSVSTDSLWYWRFPAVGEGRAGREYDRFWNAALRWLVRDPELARVRIESRRPVVPLGAPVAAEVRVLGPDYHGLASAEVMARLIPVDGADALEQRVVTGTDGSAPLAFEHVPAGAYTIRADAFSADGESLGRAEEPIVVEGADLEREAPFPRPEIMKALAEGSGGAFVTVDDDLPRISLKDVSRVEVDRTRRVPIWDSWIFYLLLIGLLSTEWVMRRRGGLI